MASTVAQVLEATVQRLGERPALQYRAGDQWESVTWKAYRARSREVARALIALGVQPGEGVAILGYNAPEWVFADVGAIFVSAIPAGIYTTSSPEQVAYITHHCDARVAFADSPGAAKKFLAAKAEMPKLERVVQWSGTPVDDPMVLSWKDFLAKGEAVPESAVDERIAAQKIDDACTLIYTSGTTGNPKGVLLSHRNVSWTAEAALDLLGLTASEEGVSYLPLSHVAEQMLTIHVPMFNGHRVTIAESMEKLPEALKMVRPTYFLGVPRVWEKMQAKMVAAGQAGSPMRKRIAAWARKVGLKGGYAIEKGGRPPLTYALANRLVFKKVRQALGFDRLNLAVTGAAPISKDTLEFFLSLGLPIYELYGMSECSGPATISTPKNYRIGKVGKIIPATEVKIAEDGEILVKGQHVFVGYLKDPKATAETLVDGWLHTGDVGEFDAEGFLKITDRKKELLITAGGENVAPQLIEGAIKAIPVVAQVVAIGDRRKFLSALLTLDPERVLVDAAAIGSPAKTTAEAATCTIFRAHVGKQLDEVNTRLARVQAVKKFTILPEELTVDGGELTPTLKLRRKVILAKYSVQIEAMYEEGEG